MCYDVSAVHREEKRDNQKRMKEIEKQFPKDYFNNKEWCKLRDKNRQADFFIDRYDEDIKRGIKF